MMHYLDKVIPGDCLEIMAKLPDHSMDMILTDLPYGCTNNAWDAPIDLQALWQQYNRLITENGVIALMSQGVFTARVIISQEDLFRFKIVWIKSKCPNFLAANRQPLKKHEDICIFSKATPTYHPQMAPGKKYDKGVRKASYTGSYALFKPTAVNSRGTRYPTDVQFFEPERDDWFYHKTAESEGKVYHDTQKPVGLGRYLIRTFTNQSAVVLDNACGSGSFLVAAVLEGRHFVGIEKCTETILHKKSVPVNYIRVCRRRIAEARRRVNEPSRA